MRFKTGLNIFLGCVLMSLIGFSFAAKINGFFDSEALVLAEQYSQQTGLPTCQIVPGSQSGSAPFLASFSGLAGGAFGRPITSYSWDLDGNGSFNDSFSQSVSRTYHQSTTVGLRVTDSIGLSNTCFASVFVNNVVTPTPTPTQNFCTQDVMQCPDGSYVGRNPNNSCQFYPCPVIIPTPTPNTCRSLTCPYPPHNCYYRNYLTYSCNPHVTLTCGQLICEPEPVITPMPVITPIIIPNVNIPSTTTIINESSDSFSSQSVNVSAEGGNAVINNSGNSTNTNTNTQTQINY